MYLDIMQDKVLIETTNRIINNIRPYDLVGRYGDEFLIGINVKNPSDELQKIIKNADNFLLKAKERGKNKIVMEEI
ncbi:MAG TPA: hypothetical protein ENG63_04765 [Candidatus Desulfofervidus auxilii]|uniref:GGDEF domain-containing protein n=1 Tax=Desulfofervidus auxilii TaxID=1621989 RepID=A0A7C0Y4A3_DESA2|nr:hypothetical protein [Candidatus Desulfofervidus auxilii]